MTEPRAAEGAQPVLVAEGLAKAYGRRRALQGLSFSLDRGRVLGFLGPNGAGKTTAIRILTTVLEPSAGRFHVDGVPSERPQEIRRRIGVLPENLGFPRHSTGLEYVSLLRAALRALGGGGAGARPGAASARGARGPGGPAHRVYSHGMRQRLGVARALVNDPVVLFLDEPTLGLDPRGQQELLRLTRRLARERNAGVVLCSHVLSEIEGVCDDVVILDAGRVVAAGPLAEVVGRARPDDGRGVRIRVPAAALGRAEEVLSALPIVRGIAHTDGSVGWLRVEVVGAAGGDRPPSNEVLAPGPVRAQGGRAGDPSPIRVTIDRRFAVVKTGDEIGFTTVVTNEGAGPSPPLILAMNIINVDEEGDVVDPEDSSPERTQYLEPLEPGASVEQAWTVEAILKGDYLVYLVAIPQPQDARETSTPVSSPGLHLTVQPFARLNPKGVLPVAIFVPLGVTLAALVLVRLRLRRIQERDEAI